MSDGRISKAHKNLALTASFLKTRLSLPLTEREQELEAEWADFRASEQGEAA